MNFQRPEIINIPKKPSFDIPQASMIKLGKVLIIFFALMIVINLITFRVHETEHAVVNRFGQVVKVIVSESSSGLEEEISANPRLQGIKVIKGKGLFLKTPFIESVNYYENRLLTYDTDPREVTTRDKKKVILDNSAQWRIVNPVLFQITVKNERGANTRLDDIMYSKLNEKIGNTDAHTLISDRAYVYAMLDTVTANTNNEVKQFGIEVVDIRIKRTDLPKENSENIFTRMKTERERQAKQYRSEGLEEAQKIRSAAEREATILEAQAYAEAERIKGEGEATALKIYADAYNRDPEFYSFYRTLEAYRQTLDGQTTIVIDANSDFAKYLFGTKR